MCNGNCYIEHFCLIVFQHWTPKREAVLGILQIPFMGLRELTPAYLVRPVLLLFILRYKWVWNLIIHFSSVGDIIISV
jgi:hypothetical protein